MKRNSTFILRCFMALVVLSLCGSAVAYSETQSDWSGESELWYPVPHWDDLYHSHSDIERFFLQAGLSLMPKQTTVTTSFSGAGPTVIADINQDGHMDVIAVSDASEGIAWWENVDGSGENWTAHVVSDDFASGYSLACSDIDNDGWLDVVSTSMESYSVRWWRNVDEGTTWVENSIDEDFFGAHCCHVSDIDSDGDNDVIGTAYYDDQIAWWENLDGTGTSWSKNVVRDSLEFTTPYSPAIASGDVNNDGYEDFLTTSIDSEIIWWENTDGTAASWVQHSIPAADSRQQCIITGDINQDGYLDIAYGDCGVFLYENSPTNPGTFSAAQEIQSEMSYSYGDLQVIDMNEDGILDIAAAGGGCGGCDYVWFENADSSCSDWTTHPVCSSLMDNTSVGVADFNEDGVLDVIGQSGYYGDIIWMDLTKYHSSGLIRSAVLDVTIPADWSEIGWNSTEPAGTSVQVRVRSGTEFEYMGGWYPVPTNPCDLSSILTAGDNLVQYSVFLETTNHNATPVFSDISIGWENFTGIGNEDSNELAILHGISPNPVSRNSVLRFTLPRNSAAQVIVYDLHGRAVQQASSYYQAGDHEIKLDNLASGVYFAALTSGDSSDSVRFAVTR